MNVEYIKKKTFSPNNGCHGCLAAAMAVILGEKSRRTEEAEVVAQRRLKQRGRQSKLEKKLSGRVAQTTKKEVAAQR